MTYGHASCCHDILLPSHPSYLGYHIYWVKTYCTQAAVKPFTLYFPYILLLSALVLLAFEKFF